MSDSEKANLFQELEYWRSRAASLELAEMAMREKEREWSNLFEGVPAILFAIDRDCRILAANRAAQEYANLPLTRLLGISLGEALQCSHREDNGMECGKGSYCSDCLLRRAVRDAKEPARELFKIEAVLPIFQQEKEVIVSASLLRGDGGERVLLYLEDISEIKQKMEEAKINLEKYKVLFDSFPLGISIADKKGNILEINDESVRLLGFSKEEHLRRRIDDPAWKIVRPDGSPMPSKEYASVRALNENRLIQNVEMGIVKKDGDVVWLSVTAAPIPLENYGVAVAFGDITERVRMEKALSESRRMLRIVLDAIPARVFWKDLNLNYLGCNRLFAIDAGLDSPDEIVGTDDFDYSAPDQAEAYRADDWEVIRTQKPKLNYEEPQIGLDGSKQFLRTSKIPLLDAQGCVIGVLGVYENITDQKKLEEQLRNALKLEAVGQLAGGVAHNINNLLTAIIGNLGLAKTASQPKLDKYLSEAMKAAVRSAELIQQLLAFSRKSDMKLKWINLNDVALESYRLARQTIDPNIEITISAEKNLPNVRADAGQIRTAIMNLCANARDAIQEAMQGKIVPERRNDRFWIEIKTESIDIDKDYVALYPFSRLGRFAVIGVSDNGLGMDKTTQDRIFDPFFTTKDVGQGTGLGLPSVYGIVKQHDGWIQVDSQRGKGTTMKIFLPAANENVHFAFYPRQEEIHGGTETILIIDDDKMLRELCKSLLAEYGYTILLAADGEEGLDIYLREKDRISLIILDLSLPRLSGGELLERILAVEPGAKIIISSGYKEDAASRLPPHFKAAGFSAKPYRFGELLQKVRSALDAPPIDGR
ncbi:MAG: PAS domain S-box protein [Candidatus Omnitrophota bacterium]